MPLPKLPTRMGDKVDPVATPSAPPQTHDEPAAGTRRGARKKATPTAALLKTAAPVTVPATPAKTGAAPSTPAATSAATPAPVPVQATAVPAPAPQAPATPAAAPARTAPARNNSKKKALPVGKRKLFVLDTNVLLHDSNSLFRFQEHDIFLPMIVLEELDHQKKGMSEVARNARQVSRYLDGLAETPTAFENGAALDALGNTDALGTLHFQTQPLSAKLPIELPPGKADNAILGVVHALKSLHKGRDVILVSKDINMRLKARSLGLAAEDYLNDHVIDDTDLLYDGVMPLPANFWTKHGKDVESWQQGGTTYYRVRGPLCSEFIVNEFVYFDGDLPLQAQVKEVSGRSAVLATLRDYSHAKNNVWGITARNREQNFALNLLMNPDIDFVSLLGQAGTGKTLLALAAALTQTLETKRYSEIIITRATVPVGDEIGFLPGTEEEKMAPWMGALEDNLEVLHLGTHGGMAHNAGGNDSGKNATMDLIRSRIKIKSMSFMRGRTFLNKYLIIDEAQNLTPKQMKTLVTRAGPGTKIICLGNIAQIDTPYLTEGSSGLTYVVDRFKGWPHAGHITLQRGERSRLADYASEAL
ncbi:MAG: PhoH family protein [Burkholderiaceae bacterium]